LHDLFEDGFYVQIFTRDKDESFATFQAPSQAFYAAEE
jgi:hypothetical protein